MQARPRQGLLARLYEADARQADECRVARRQLFTDVLGQRLGERLRGVVLFGSTARGEARSGSDVDILLDVATDGRIYLDRDGFVAEHLTAVRLRLAVLGSRRVRSPPGGWYWELKPGMRAGEVTAL